MNEGPRYPAPVQPPKGHGQSLYTNPGRVPGPWVYGLSPKERRPAVPLMQVEINTDAPSIIAWKAHHARDEASVEDKVRDKTRYPTAGSRPLPEPLTENEAITWGTELQRRQK